VLDGQASIGPTGVLILPKLSRRCTDFLKARAQGFPGNLDQWLIEVSRDGRRVDDDLVVLPGGTEVRLSSLVRQENRTIVFPPDLLEIVFVEK
jgi:hypothetical protein